MMNVTGRMYEMLEMMREMRVQLDVVEEDRRRGLNPRHEDESDDELDHATNQNEEALKKEEEDLDQVKMLKAISKIGKRPRIEIENYAGNLNPEELIDWINDMEEYFEYEEIEDLERVTFV